MCCGYPERLNQEDYAKADRTAYFDLADAIERSSIDAVSIEDAHQKNDLKLLEKFQKTTIILGVVHIANTRVETVEEIRTRLQQALEHIDPARLIAGPDCGLGMLDEDTVVKKMTNLALAAHSFS